MPEYRYPKIKGKGFRWHIIYKYWLETGGESPTLYDQNEQSVFRFKEALTPDQHAVLERLATESDPFSPDSPVTLDDPENTLFVSDLFGTKYWFQEWIDSMGIPGLVGSMWFVSTGEHGTRKDGILVKFNKELTQAERKKVEKAYSSAGQFGSFR